MGSETSRYHQDRNTEFDHIINSVLREKNLHEKKEKSKSPDLPDEIQVPSADKGKKDSISCHISHKNKDNVINNSKYDASVNLDFSKFKKKMEARSVNKSIRELQLKDEKSSRIIETFNGIERLCRTIGFICGSVYLLNKVKLQYDKKKRIFKLF